MTWSEFLLLYTALAAMLLVVFHRLFAHNWWRLARVMALAGSMGFFVDYPAEDRSFWKFAGRSSFYVIEVPIENIILMVASVVYMLLIYLPLRNSLRLRSGQSRNPRS